jgi:hypothetical protein
MSRPAGGRPSWSRIPVEVVTHSHYRIAPANGSWSITVNRSGTLPEVTLATTRAEAIRRTRRLSDSGLIGYIGEEAYG